MAYGLQQTTAAQRSPWAPASRQQRSFTPQDQTVKETVAAQADYNQQRQLPQQRTGNGQSPVTATGQLSEQPTVTPGNAFQNVNQTTSAASGPPPGSPSTGVTQAPQGAPIQNPGNVPPSPQAPQAAPVPPIPSPGAGFVPTQDGQGWVPTDHPQAWHASSTQTTGQSSVQPNPANMSPYGQYPGRPAETVYQAGQLPSVNVQPWQAPTLSQYQFNPSQSQAPEAITATQYQAQQYNPYQYSQGGAPDYQAQNVTAQGPATAQAYQFTQPNLPQYQTTQFDTGASGPRSGQTMGQFTAPDQSQVGNAQQTALMQALQGSPLPVDQMKSQARDAAVQMAQQQSEQANQAMAARGLGTSGQASALQRQIEENQQRQILEQFRGIDVTAANQRQSDLLNAISSAEGVQSGQMNRATSAFGTQLAGQQAQAGENTTQFQSGIAQQQALNAALGQQAGENLAGWNTGTVAGQLGLQAQQAQSNANSQNYQNQLAGSQFGSQQLQNQANQALLQNQSQLANTQLGLQQQQAQAGENQFGGTFNAGQQLAAQQSQIPIAQLQLQQNQQANNLLQQQFTNQFTAPQFQQQAELAQAGLSQQAYNTQLPAQQAALNAALSQQGLYQNQATNAQQNYAQDIAAWQGQQSNQLGNAQLGVQSQLGNAGLSVDQQRNQQQTMLGLLQLMQNAYGTNQQMGYNYTALQQGGLNNLLNTYGGGGY